MAAASADAESESDKVFVLLKGEGENEVLEEEDVVIVGESGSIVEEESESIVEESIGIDDEADDNDETQELFGEEEPGSVEEVEEEDEEVDDKVVLDADLLERVDILEDGVNKCRGRLDAFSHELKILLVEINIVSEWIKDKFGIQLFDKGARIFKHIHDFEEIDELSNTLSLVKNGINNSKKRSKASKTMYKSSDEEDDDDEDGDDDEGGDDDDDDEEDSDEFVFDPPECVIQDPDNPESEEGDGRARRATRKRINYSELAEGIRRKAKVGRPSKKDGKRKQKQRKPYKWRSKEEREQRKQEKLVPKKRGRPKKKPEEKVQPVKDHPPMMCEECGKILKGPGSLKSHMDMHADRRPFPCPMEGCDKKFRVRNKLAIHMIIHKGEKTEQCRFCGRLFYFQKDLARHERTHTGEKPHGCPLCPKSFNVKQHLTLHIRTHTGEKPYTCPTCEKTFSQANSLRIHKKIHLKVKGEAPIRKPRGPPKNKVVMLSGLMPIAGTSQKQEPSSSTIVHPNERTVIPISSLAVAGPINTSQIRQQIPRGAAVTETKFIIHTPCQEIIMDPVQQAWKLASDQPQNSLGTVQFPIYGFETTGQSQEQRQIIQNPSADQRMFTVPQFTATDPGIRYFTGE